MSGKDESLEAQLKAMIVERLFLSLAPEQIADDDVLAEKLRIDSIQLYEIVVGTEELFQVSFADEEMNAGAFATVRDIAALVREKRAAPPAAPAP